MPLLIIFLIVLTIFVIKTIRRLILISKIKRHAQKIYNTHIKLHSYVSLFCGKHVLFESKDDLSIAIIFIPRKYAKYHFTSPNNLEIYVGNRTTYRVSSLKHAIGNNVNWNLKGKIKIEELKVSKKIVIFNKPPMDITSSDPQAADFLGNEDVIFKTTIIFSAKHFLNKSTTK